MYILFRKKIIANITSITEFEKFILENNFYTSFKKFPNEKINEINSFIEKTEKINYKEIKPSLKKIINYGNTQNNINFLLLMGWDKLDAKDFISKKQKRIAGKLVDVKKSNPTYFYDKTPTRIEYWLRLGYDLDTAKNLLKDRQRTFSLEKCVKKYGEEKGKQIFLERQTKWINSLKNTKIIYSNNSYNYESTPHDSIIKRTSFIDKRKELILSAITKNTIDGFVKYIIDNIDIKRISDILPYVNSNIIKNHYNIEKELIKEKFYSLLPQLNNKNLYGFCIYHNGIRYKSIGEYKLALFLISKNIHFLYEKNYPNSNFLYDFYLPKYNIFIEYFGLIKNKNEKNFNKIQLNYVDKMNKKIKFCKENNLELIFDVDCNTLINKIKKIIDENKN
jgi:hypothetical protein